MNVVIIQPPYPKAQNARRETVQYMIGALKSCAPDADLIVLPEYANAPGASGREEILSAAREHTAPLFEAAQSAARRLSAFVAVNMALETADGLRNTTLLFDRGGRLVHEYIKQHLPPAEVEALNYSYRFRSDCGCIARAEGVTFGFLTCYDVNFSEQIDLLAKRKADILLFPSYQRSVRTDILEAQAKMLAYRTNAHVLRASYAMGEGSATGGTSLILSPDGTILAGAGQRAQSIRAAIDPKEKRLYTFGYGREAAAGGHADGEDRTPWCALPGGPFVVPEDRQMPYPRICAHRGFNTIAPENSMPAFGAAVSLGAQEIEFDLWATKDGELVACHDSRVDRVSDGTGLISELTLHELKKMDFGSVYSETFRGLSIPTFEEVLREFACRTIINLHIKSNPGEEIYNPRTFEKIAGLIEKYGCEKHLYIMGGAPVLKSALSVAPDIARCCGEGQLSYNLVDNAILYRCEKLQFFKPYFNREQIEKAHAHGIRCNIFWSDEPDEARGMLEMGIDTILCNDAQRVLSVLNQYKRAEK